MNSFDIIRMVQSTKPNMSKYNGFGITRHRKSNEIEEMTRKHTIHTPLRYNVRYVLIIDFKYTVVSLLILIGFAMFTCGTLVLFTFSFKYAQMTNEIKRV